ncbi:MAG: peptidase U32 family protein [Bacteroidota bacterium]
MRREDIEIMAPVGSYESLQAAIQAGTGSVYFGAGNLNMRSKSTFNFSLNDLQTIVELCRTHHINTYLTLNTILYNNDLQEMRCIIDTAKESGITAVIASDIAAIRYAWSVGIEVHISTQLNISNTESLKFFAQFADVIVLARELTLDQVKEITKTIKEEHITGPSGKPVRIELFIHGALCMAISGKCYLSLHEKNYSANRGKCLQICRRSYIVKDKESERELEIDNEYIMSPKDLSTISFLNKILDAGVQVLKIEGRARSPEYVKTVTECYHEAVDAYFDGSYTEKKISAWQTRLATVFNRGFWDGYYLGRKLGEWSHQYGSQATTRKIYVGKITNYYKKNKIAEILPEANTVNVKDKIMIIGPTTGVIQSTVSEIRVDDKNVYQSPKKIKCSIPLSRRVRPRDKLYKVVDASKSETQ